MWDIEVAERKTIFKTLDAGDLVVAQVEINELGQTSQSRYLDDGVLVQIKHSQLFQAVKSLYHFYAVAL